MEELRRADPALLTPIRPLGGLGLGIGRAAPAIAAEVLAAIGDSAEATTEIPPEAVEAAPAAGRESPGAAQVSAVPEGAVRGDGTATCPTGFPVKGNAQSKIFHTEESRVYGQTIAEICFSSEKAAQAAGYRPPRNL